MKTSPLRINDSPRKVIRFGQRPPRCPGRRSFPTNVQADVCIVGAGIAGLTTGYLLTQAGKSVVILDDGELASGMTQVTTAHFPSAIDDRFTEIETLARRAGRVPGRRKPRGGDQPHRSHRRRSWTSTAISRGSTVTCFSHRATKRSCSTASWPRHGVPG